MFVSPFPLPAHKIHTTYVNLHSSVTSIEVKRVCTHTASSLPSRTAATHGLTCLLGRQGKHMWLIVRQVSIKSGWVNLPLTLRDLAEAILLNIARIADTFSRYHLQPPQHCTSVTDTHRSSKIDITPTPTTTITPTATITNSPTKIPALVSINTSLPPRSCMPFSHTSSVTTPLSPSARTHYHLPLDVAGTPTIGTLEGMCPRHTNNSQKKSPSLGDFDTLSSQQRIRYFIATNSPGFHFSASNFPAIHFGNF